MSWLAVNVMAKGPAKTKLRFHFLVVAVDSDGSPVTVSWSGDSRRNIIVWMDHRAVEQAERINSRNSPVLQYCGGALSPEMQPPKVLQVTSPN